MVWNLFIHRWNHWTHWLWILLQGGWDGLFARKSPPCVRSSDISSGSDSPENCLLILAKKRRCVCQVLFWGLVCLFSFLYSSHISVVPYGENTPPDACRGTPPLSSLPPSLLNSLRKSVRFSAFLAAAWDSDFSGSLNHLFIVHWSVSQLRKFCSFSSHLFRVFEKFWGLRKKTTQC